MSRCRTRRIGKRHVTNCCQQKATQQGRAKARAICTSRSSCFPFVLSSMCYRLPCLVSRPSIGAIVDTQNKTAHRLLLAPQLVWEDGPRSYAKKQNARKKNTVPGREQIIDGKNDEMARGVAIHPTGPPFAAYLQQMGRSIRRRRPRCIACAQRACPAVDDEYSKLLGMTRASQTPRSLAGG